MVKEASKTKSLFGELEEKIFKGNGLDIGCGDDPIFADVRKFDIEDGDANNISSYVNERFDYVFSSHCLEHMYDPHCALKEWWSLVKMEVIYM
ncbi:MAG: class I SAM-dependent methyltransferase [Puniceicoccales bacterium]|jgi:predicted SAM-dependent methyltransferase|nr:class I SAM-dependent methyltransferase [Puniceicoccales bacterium]